MKKLFLTAVLAIGLSSAVHAAPEIYAFTNLPVSVPAVTFTNLLKSRVGVANVVANQPHSLWAKVVGTNPVASGVFTSNKVTLYFNVAPNNNTNNLTTGNVFPLDVYPNGTNPVVVVTNIPAVGLGASAIIALTGFTNSNAGASNAVRPMNVWVTRD